MKSVFLFFAVLAIGFISGNASVTVAVEHSPEQIAASVTIQRGQRNKWEQRAAAAGNAVVDGAETVADGAEAAVNAMGDGIEAIGDGAVAAVNTVGEGIDTINEGIESAANEVTEAANNIEDGIQSVTKSVDNVADSANELGDSVEDLHKSTKSLAAKLFACIFCTGHVEEVTPPQGGTGTANPKNPRSARNLRH